MDPLDHFDTTSSSPGEWIDVESELVGLDGKKKIIKIELMQDNKPRALAFFDIDETLAHLDMIHGPAIQKLFPGQDEKELETTYYQGFKLGSSIREFDRMRGIYADGHVEWKDPEIYFKERLVPNMEEIDKPGHLAHSIATDILKEYGKVAAEVCEELYKKDSEKFTKSNIAPIFLLAQMYFRLGIPLVGFTANAKVLVDKLAKYLKLSDFFIDIATDENMTGGGKEIAIHHLIARLEAKGVPIPKGRLIFVGDSLRGDIGTSLKAKGKDQDLSGQGILVLKDKAALVEIKKQINGDPELRAIVDSINIHGLIVSDVPLDEKGNPMLLSRFRGQFLEKL